ncbi:MAG: hypothetical protein NZ772_05595 [Cyanobacteria bacterium]|nr:hypothetical protein [Cyanobacteriota bacterium]MDW8200995.1 hypothetical protein [Cyanobacteriota bacterium SKYGB_h_bin112]
MSNLESGTDNLLQHQVQRLQRLTVYTRWVVVSILWLTVGSYSLWLLRDDIVLMYQYFTWAALRYALAYQPVAAVGISLCIGMTVAVLVWQSRNILWGLPRSERQRFEQQVLRIRKQGPSHPLWKWVCR